MFQLGSLVVLCSLLIGNSESILGPLGNAVNNILTPPSGDTPQNVNLDLESLQQVTNKNGILETLNKMDLSNVKGVTTPSGLSVKIKNLKFLDFQSEPALNGNGIGLKLLLAADISVGLPLTSDLVDASVSLGLINSLSIKPNAQTGLPEVTIHRCFTNTDKISISLLGRQSPLVNGILDNASTFLTRTVSTLLQNFLCPVLQYILNVLNPSVLQSILSTPSAGQLQVPL